MSLAPPASLLMLAAFACLALLVHVRALAGLDTFLRQAMQAPQDCTLLALARQSSVLFAIEVSVGISIVLSGILWRVAGPWAALAPWILYVALAIELALKLLADQPGPPNQPWPALAPCGDTAYPFVSYPTPSAFPSGYTSRMAFFLVLAVALLRPRLPTWAASAATLAVVAVILWLGWTRVYIAWHWPTDVLGGILLGTALALIAARVITSTWRRPSSP